RPRRAPPAPRGGAGAAASASRSTSIVHSVSRAAAAPSAARPGAATAPTRPTVIGNSATVREPCRMITRRTLPSWMSFFTNLSRSSPFTLNVSHWRRTVPPTRSYDGRPEKVRGARCSALTLDRPALARQQLAEPLPLVALQLHGGLRRPAARAAGLLQLLQQRREKRAVSRQAAHHRDGLAGGALLEPQRGPHLRRNWFIGRAERGRAAAIVRRPAALGTDAPLVGRIDEAALPAHFLR